MENGRIHFDYVINLAAETRYGQPESVYASRCSELSYLCAKKAMECGVTRFIEVVHCILSDHDLVGLNFVRL